MLAGRTEDEKCIGDDVQHTDTDVFMLTVRSKRIEKRANSSFRFRIIQNGTDIGLSPQNPCNNARPICCQNFQTKTKHIKYNWSTRSQTKVIISFS